MAYERNENFNPALILVRYDDNTSTILPTARSLTNAQPIDVALVDTSGEHITPFGADANTTGVDTVFDSDGDNTAQQCKASAGVLYHLEVSNPNSADAYIQLFDDTTGNVTVGSTTPKLSFFVPAGDGTKDGAMDKFFNIPIEFDTAITYACTTTATGNGDPTTGLVVNLLYK